MSKYTDLRDSIQRSSFLSEADQRLVHVELATPDVLVPAWRIALRTAAAALRQWRANREARRGLAELDARSLRDIGISPAMADYEASRPPWHSVRDLRS
jgi:uncharacterized protein YjiS (DUF1127 family)